MFDEGENIKLIINEDKVFLTQKHFLLLSQTPLNFAGIFKLPAYIVVKIKAYTDDRKSISVEPVSYHPGNTHFDNYQHQIANTLNTIASINFSSLDTGAIFGIKNGRQVRLPKSINEIHRNRPLRRETIRSLPIQRESVNYLPIQNNTIRPLPIKLNETFQINIKDIEFGDGFIRFSLKIKDIYDNVDISIENSFIKKEFNVIKSYFSKAFKSNKIQVTVNIEHHNNTVISKSATSPQIDMINDDIIKDIRMNYLKASIRNKIKKEDNNKIFTTDSLFNKVSDGEINQKIFYQNDDSFLNDVLKITEKKHFKQLKYLSRIHDAKTMKLRFVTKPFSFIFLFSGKSKFHIIWETLDTKEATYIWTVDQNLEALKQGFVEIENIINRIMVNGKTQYIQSENNSSKRIYHDYSENDGFLKWKNDIKNILK